MRRLMDSDRIRTVITEALSVSLQGVQLPGIADAEVRKVDVSSEQLQRLAAELEQHGHSEVRLSADVELFLRVSNTEVLSAIERTEFLVRVDAEESDLRAVASNEKDWAMAWERGIEPIKQAALQGMRRDVRTFLGYPRDLVQVMAARLQEAQIWQGDEVRCESWFDPKKGAIAFLPDILVAEGELIRKWSEEKKEYRYYDSRVAI